MFGSEETGSRAHRDIFAHSLPDAPREQWERLADHLAAVGEGASRRAAAFHWQQAARAAGLLHDIGKTSAEFQAYISGASPETANGSGRGSVDHSTAGAREAAQLYGQLGKLLAFGIAGHHAGLPDADNLGRRLFDSVIPAYAGWEPHAGELPATADIRGPLEPGAPPGFAAAFLTRMLFSCLVDADFVETERFYSEANGAPKERHGFTPIGELADRLKAHLATVRRDDTELNRLRSRVLDHATDKATLPPGLFTLTVPTGGGKTLTSLSFALEHARRHGLRRVIYVIPFTSIIEQTAAVFRKALATDEDVLEHHANFDWEAALPAAARVADADGGQGPAGLARLRRAAENWEAPIVVTTAVQFFESLFASRTSRCRKLHNIAKAVIVLDEAQTLPLPLLQPCLAAIDELARNYGSTVVLCTATQPAIRKQDGFDGGLDIPADRELAPEPAELYARLKRVTVERRLGPTDDSIVEGRFRDRAQMLCIVNSRGHAHDLFARIAGMDGATHLSTLMCPRHRRKVLEDVRERLRRGAPVRLVATSLIEAGVDVDFPEVWRAMAGLDQVAQAAGRANREGGPVLGRVVVFTPANHLPPHALKSLQGVADGVLRRQGDPLTLDAIHAYFSQLYWQKGPEAFDGAKLDGVVFPIMRSIAERARLLDFPFDSIARAFRLIDQALEPVIVPWGQGARAALHRLSATDRPRVADLRLLQQYVVPIPRKARGDWLAEGALAPVHPALGDTLVKLADETLYDKTVGLRLDGAAYRSAEANVF